MYEEYRKYLKKIRAEIFQETKSFFEQKKCNDTTCEQALHNLSRWNREAKEREGSMPYINDSKTVVLIDNNVDSLDMAKYIAMIYGVLPTVLNFANKDTIGGGCVSGASAQEENMFRRSNCWACIRQEERDSTNPRRYNTRMARQLEAKDAPRVYLDTQQIRVGVRGRETHEKAAKDIGYKWLHKTQWFPFYELRAAAWDLAKIQMDAKTITEDADRRIEAQFQTLIYNNIEFVVLGAFWCGAFQNPPEIIASIYFEKIAKYKHHFKVIAFPIIWSDTNFDTFNSAARALASNYSRSVRVASVHSMLGPFGIATAELAFCQSQLGVVAGDESKDGGGGGGARGLGAAETPGAVVLQLQCARFGCDRLPRDDCNMQHGFCCRNCQLNKMPHSATCEEIYKFTAQCRTAGCTRAPYLNNRANTCCRTCGKTGGQHHGPACFP